jgi:hypothetical protein
VKILPLPDTCIFRIFCQFLEKSGKNVSECGLGKWSFGVKKIKMAKKGDYAGI